MIDAQCEPSGANVKTEVLVPDSPEASDSSVSSFPNSPLEPFLRRDNYIGLAMKEGNSSLESILDFRRILEKTLTGLIILKKFEKTGELERKDQQHLVQEIIDEAILNRIK